MQQVEFKVQLPPTEGAVVRAGSGIKVLGFISKVQPVLDEPDQFVVTVKLDMLAPDAVQTTAEAERNVDG